MLQRLKNLWHLSKYGVEEPVQGAGATRSIGPPRLTSTAKPKKKLATIIEPDPIDIFPNADENL